MQPMFGCCHLVHRIVVLMKVLHVAPGDLAGGSLREALRLAGSNRTSCRFTDDLSRGPIAWAHRARERHGGRMSMTSAGRRSRGVLASHRNGQRTARRLVRTPLRQRARLLPGAGRSAGRPALRHRRRHRSAMDVPSLMALQGCPTCRRGRYRSDGPAGAARPHAHLAAGGRDAGRLWQHLRAQNAPFRMVTSAGLASAPIDHFDSSNPRTGAQGMAERRVRHRIDDGAQLRPYIQVGDVMLLARLVALVESASSSPMAIPGI